MSTEHVRMCRNVGRSKAKYPEEKKKKRTMQKHKKEERKGQRFRVIIKLIHIHVEAIVPVWMTIDGMNGSNGITHGDWSLFDTIVFLLVCRFVVRVSLTNRFVVYRRGVFMYTTSHVRKYKRITLNVSYFLRTSPEDVGIRRHFLIYELLGTISLRNIANTWVK